MESHAEAVGMMDRVDVHFKNTDYSSNEISVDIPTATLFDRVLFFVKAILEYAFGTHMGFAVGWVLGWIGGHVYAEHFKPVYSFDLNELHQWELMPYEFARSGAVVGIIAGVIAIALINNKILTQRVMSLYEKGITKPKDICQVIGKSERQIRRVINKLAKKEKICKKTYSQKDYQAEGPIPLESVVGMCEIP